MKALFDFFLRFGINLHVLTDMIIHLPGFVRDYMKFRKLLGNNPDWKMGKLHPVTVDKRKESGKIKGVYFHQDLLVARRIFQENPLKHIDIGSRIDGFVAHVSIFREVEIFDIRPLNSTVRNIVFRQADFMTLPDDLHNYCDSVSSLHAIEHFGLGRYGDPFDPDGHIKAVKNIHKMLKPGGKFYFSVPIGKQRIEFNAHRIFNVGYLLNLLNEFFIVEHFSFVNDQGDLTENATITDENVAQNFGCNYGCGIFELRKK